MNRNGNTDRNGIAGRDAECRGRREAEVPQKRIRREPPAGDGLRKRNGRCRRASGAAVLAVRAVWFLWLAGAVAGCRSEPGPDRAREFFLGRNAPGLVLSTGYAFEYDAESCQQVSNPVRKQLRYQTDDQSSYVNMTFRRWPAGGNAPGHVRLDYVAGLRSNSMDLDMEVLKTEGDRIWLWNDSCKTGLVLRLEEWMGVENR